MRQRRRPRNTSIMRVELAARARAGELHKQDKADLSKVKDVLLGGGGGGTTVNVFQNDVTWNNDANLSKQAPPSLVPSRTCRNCRTCLNYAFPKLGDWAGERGATLAVLAEHMFVVVGMSVSQSVRANMRHPSTISSSPPSLPSSLCEQEFLMWVSSSPFSPSLFILIRGYRCPHLRLHPLHMVVALTRPCLASADTRLALRK